MGVAVKRRALALSLSLAVAACGGGGRAPDATADAGADQPGTGGRGGADAADAPADLNPGADHPDAAIDGVGGGGDAAPADVAVGDDARIDGAPGDAIADNRTTTDTGRGDTSAADAGTLLPAQPCQLLGLGYPHELALSPDGALLAVAGTGGLIKILRAADGADVRTLVVPAVSQFAVAFSPDGASIVAGGQDGSLRAWRASDGTPLWTVPAAHGAPVVSVRFAPGGATFASIASNGGGRLSRASDGNQVATFGHYKGGRGLAFSPDGQWLASGGERFVGGDIIDSASQVTIWRASDAQLVRSLNFTNLGGPAVAFTPDSLQLALAIGTTLKLVRVADGTDATIFTGAPNGATRLAITPDGATLLANGMNGTTIWSVATGALLRRINDPNLMVEGLAVTPDGARVVSGVNWTSDQRLHVNRVADGGEVWSVTGLGIVTSLSYAPSGLLASGGYDTSVHVWSDGGAALRVLPGGAIPTNGAFIGDGSSLLVSGDGLFVVRASDWQTTAQIASQAGSIALSADGALLATATYPKTLALYALPALTAGATFNDSATQVNAIALSPDCALLASGSSNGEVIVRRLGSDAAAAPHFTAHAGGTYALAFSPDGRTLATAGADGPVRLWQMPDGNPGLVLGSQTAHGLSIAFTPDGASVAVGFEDGVIRSWRVADGGAGVPLVSHTLAIYALAFSRDGRRLASAGADTTVRVWCAP